MKTEAKEALKKIFETLVIDISTKFPVGEVVSIEISDPISKAIEVLLKSDVSSVLVIDSDKRAVIGMIDMLDILSYLVNILPSQTEMDENYERAIAFRAFALASEPVRSVLYASDRSTSLAIQRSAKLIDIIDLFAEGFHRLAIVDEKGFPLKIVSQSAVNSFFLSYSKQLESILNDKIDDLNLWTKLPISVPANSKTVDVLRVIKETKRSGVAIVEQIAEDTKKDRC